MKSESFLVRENRRIAEGVYDLHLIGDASSLMRPGQFVNIAVDGCFLRRPLSVCDYTKDSLRLIYKTIGHGTTRLCLCKAGQALDLLLPLGNGFTPIEKASEKEAPPLLIGGGLGTPPLFALAKALLHHGERPDIILGFNGKADIFLVDEFSALGLSVTLCTVDGSCGRKGTVLDALLPLTAPSPSPIASSFGPSSSFTSSSIVSPRRFYTCGPLPMMKAVYHLAKKSGWRGQFSLEERMGCGFGACMGCSMQTRNGTIRLCKEGPVVAQEDLPW